MKKKIVQCDVCKREIKPKEDRYHFKAIKRELRHIGYDSFIADIVKNCDLCMNCYLKFLRFVERENDKNEI